MVSERIREARELRNACAANGVSSDAKRAIRGHIYITLYGMYERAVADCVSTAIIVANSHAIPLSSLKNGIQLLAMHPDFASHRAIREERTWERGLQLLRKLYSTDAAQFESVFPADGSFMRPSQLRLLWDIFELPGDPWPDPRFMGRIIELVEARNDVAHGSEGAGQRGGRVSDRDMDDRITDIEALCVHFINSFAAQLTTPAGYVR